MTGCHSQMIRREFQLQRLIFNHSHQFDNTLARYDKLLLGCDRKPAAKLIDRQALTIGRHHADTFSVNLNQHAVEKIPDILLRHGEHRLVQQRLQIRWLQNLLNLNLIHLSVRKICHRQGCQMTPELPAGDTQARPLKLTRHHRVTRQRATDIHQLARGYCGTAFF